MTLTMKLTKEQLDNIEIKSLSDVFDKDEIEYTFKYTLDCNELNDEQINAIQQFLINQDFIDYCADKTGISIWFNDQKQAEKMKQKVISILETLN